MSIHFDSTEATIWHGDCIDVMRSLPDASIDACVTDPPYDLTAGKKGGTGAASINLDSPYGRSRIGTGNGAGGFMGKAWDATGIAFDVATWAEVYRVLKPGGWVLSFGGTRTFHRMAVAIEDAGFEIRDSIAWLYGSGFPKSLDVSKAIDRIRDDTEQHAAVARFLVGYMEARGVTRADMNRRFGFSTAGSGASQQWTTTTTDRVIKPRVPTWDQWAILVDWLGLPEDMDAEVWRLNGLKGTPGDAWKLRPDADYSTGVGMATSWTDGKGWNGNASKGGAAIREDAARWQGWGTALKPAFEPVVVARKPLTGTVAGNVLAYGTGALNIDASRIAGDNPSIARRESAARTGWDNRGGSIMNDRTDPERYQEPRSSEQLGRWPANVILDESQAAALDEQSGVLTSGANPTRRNADMFRDTYSPFKGQTDLTPARGADSGGASRFFYTAKASTDERPNVDGIAHPTVKPLDLMRWLVRLVTPKGGIVLEPFAGSGTTVEAAVLEGFRCIAIEREADYLPLIMQRLSKPHAVGLDIDWEDAS